MRFAPRTILGQLITGSVIVQALVFAAFLLLSIRREFRETQQADRQRLIRQARTVVGVLQEPLATGNSDMLDHIVSSIPISVTIGVVRITDAAGNTLRSSNPAAALNLTEPERALLPDLLLHPDYHLWQGQKGTEEGVQPVVVDGVVRGIVWITPDESVTRRMPVLALRHLALYATCALLGNLLLLWWLSASLARPLRQLRRATLQLQNNPDDLSAFPLPARVHNEAGELQASFNAMVNEITLQRKGTQETLSLLDAMLEGAPIGFAFFDREFRYVRLNRNLATMHGIPLQDHLGQRYRDLLPGGASRDLADTLEALMASVFNSGMPVSDYEMSGVRPGTTELRTLQKSLFPIPHGDERVRWVGAIVIDITERRRTEEAMRRSERLAAAGRLAASIAHEINNPVESVTNLLYLLRNNTSLDAEAQEYTAMAQAELGRVAEVTHQTLKFFRRSALPTDVRLAEVLRSVLVLHQARMQSPHIQVKLNLSEKAVSFGNPGELRQVFANLIGNAIDAMPQGGTLHVKARAMWRMGKHGTRVTFADTGSGMPEIVRQRIFEPFFTTKEVTGTGLGLWVSSEILAKHRATLLVRSRVASGPAKPSGTVFSIFFPQDGVPRGPIRVRTAARNSADQAL